MPASPTSSERRPCWCQRPLWTRSWRAPPVPPLRPVRRPSNGPQPGHHPPGRVREVIRARRGREVHLPRQRQGAQDADPPGRRAAVGRQGGRGPHRLGEVQAQAPRADRGAHAPVEEGHGRAARGRFHPDLPGVRGPRVMPIRKPKPTSPGLRFVSYPDFAEVTRTTPEKSLTEGLKKSGGRNSNGRKTARPRGGGAKRPSPRL